ncbi:MAG: NUDIX domain-containing protein [Gemmatimonadota bacterium]
MSDVGFERLERETVYRGRVVDVLRDRIRIETDAGSRETVYEVVHHPGAVGVLALFPDGSIALLRQFRYPTEETLWEIPAGTLAPGESFRECAERELEEETGHRARRWLRLARFFTTPGFCDEVMEIWMAEELEEGDTAHDEDEHIEVVRVPLTLALDWAAEGEVRDAKTLAGLWKVRVQLEAEGRWPPKEGW